MLRKRIKMHQNGIGIISVELQFYTKRGMLLSNMMNGILPYSRVSVESMPFDAVNNMTANVALKCNAGDIAWLAIQCVTSLLCSLGNECGGSGSGSGSGNGNGGDNEVGYQASGSAAIIEPVSVLIDGTTFASSLAALRHFVRRFPGSRAVLNIALEGYVFLSDTILITPYGNDDNDVDTKIDHVRRRALFSSLCRGALPFGIRSEISCQLHDHHLAEVSTLMRIVHSNHDYVLEDWHLVLQTLDRLSYLPIRSNNLSEDGCRTALSMTEIYRRLSRFTTCLSHKSLKFFIDSVLELCKMSSFENTLDEQSPTLLNDNNNLVNQKDHTEGMVNNVGGKNHIGLSPNRKDSFGGKFFNFARSFASGNSQLHDQDERVFISSKSRGTITGSSSKTYHQDFCDSTLDGLKPRLVSNNSEVVRGTEFIRSIPFPLILLAELSFENSFRFVLFGQSILDFLCDLAAGIGDSIKSDSPNVRLFAMNVLTNLVTSGLSGIADSNDMG